MASGIINGETLSDITRVLDTIEIVSFIIFKERIASHGSLGSAENIGELIAKVLTYYSELDQSTKAYLESMTGGSVRAMAKYFCDNSNVPGLYEQWRMFRVFVETKAIHVYTFTEFDGNNAEKPSQTN